MEEKENKHAESTRRDTGENGEDVKKEFKGFLASSRRFLFRLFNIKTDTDREATKAAIISDISFRGHTIWILVCSIFICCIGLNANSTAVVIGAMLISPLMGPILGVGMAFATNDMDTLRRALKNFLIMVISSVLTAYLFFRFFPLQSESSELLARTAPDIRDVLIAFFGGMALVIARAKRGTVASVIFGVAIATALMPPLCTVGFGVAIRNYDYAIGAFYLFTINAIFIAVATFIIIKFLGLPVVRYVKSTTRRLIARIASVLAILVMVPAGITFYDVFQESRFKVQAQEFLRETIEVYQFEGNGYYLDNLTEIRYSEDEESVIEIVCVGDAVIPKNIIDTWKVQMADYPKLQNTELRIVQGGASDIQQRLRYIDELYESKKAELANSEARIRVLEEEIAQLNLRVERQIPFQNISAEARTNYENLENIGFSYIVKTDFSKTDTVPVFEVKWKSGTSANQRQTDRAKMMQWLRLRLEDSTIQVREFRD